MSEGRAVVEEFRQLARVVEIDDVIAHPNADKLELAIIGGWQVCIRLGEFKKGDWALYCEIDALVPTDLPEFAFLEDRGENLKSFNDRTYCRIKTIKLRKEISQGLLIPIPAALASEGKVAGDDCTEALGILKYDKSASKTMNSVEPKLSWYHRLALWVLGPQPQPLPFPGFLRKSEENRVQNTSSQYKRAVENGEQFEISVKLDGESMTVYSSAAEGEFYSGVCSRNCEIEQNDTVFTPVQAVRRWVGLLMLRNRRAIRIAPITWPTVKGFAWLREFWSLNRNITTFNFGVPQYITRIAADLDPFLNFALKHDLMGKLYRVYRNTGIAYTIQGEVIGPGIQGNYEGVTEKQFFVYRVYFNGITPLLPAKAREVCLLLGVNYIPVLEESIALPPVMKDLIRYAEGPRIFTNSGVREGVVVKSTVRDFSMKIISEKYLLNEK